METLDGYRPGGYHPVMIGDVLHHRYRIIDKLGHGGHSTTWLALDSSLRQYTALKVCTTVAPRYETEILQALSSPSSHPGRQLVPTLLDEFEVSGLNGKHLCYTKSPARSSLSEDSFSRLFPIDVARALCAGLTRAVAYVHSQGFIHGG